MWWRCNRGARWLVEMNARREEMQSYEAKRKVHSVLDEVLALRDTSVEMFVYIVLRYDNGDVVEEAWLWEVIGCDREEEDGQELKEGCGQGLKEGVD